MLQKAQNDNVQSHINSMQTASPGTAQAASRHAQLKALRKVVSTIENQDQPPLLDETITPKPEQNHSKSHIQTIALPSGGLHELWAKNPVDQVTVTALILTTLKKSEGPFLWITSRRMIQEYGLPYGHGLKAAGVDPERLILVQCCCQKDVLWALEEGLKSRALSAVIGEVGSIELSASRRLVLAARKHNTRGILLLRSETAPSSAAFSRWQTSSSPSENDLFDKNAPGTALLSTKLVKHRGGRRPTQHLLEWPYATDHLPVVAPMVDQSTIASKRAERQATG